MSEVHFKISCCTIVKQIAVETGLVVKSRKASCSNSYHGHYLIKKTFWKFGKKIAYIYDFEYHCLDKIWRCDLYDSSYARAISDAMRKHYADSGVIEIKIKE